MPGDHAATDAELVAPASGRAISGPEVPSNERLTIMRTSAPQPWFAPGILDHHGAPMALTRTIDTNPRGRGNR